MFDAIIYFTDNTHIIVPNASNYNWGEVEGAVSVETNKNRLFFNKSHIKCIGIPDEMGTLKITEVFNDE